MAPATMGRSMGSEHRPALIKKAHGKRPRTALLDRPDIASDRRTISSCEAEKIGEDFRFSRRSLSTQLQGVLPLVA